MSLVMLILAIVLIHLAAYPAVLFVWNLFLFRAPRKDLSLDTPPVSVMIPARNEEDNIGKAVESVLASTDVDLELLVLDDNSDDRTGEIVSEFAEKDGRVKLLSGKGLAEGWAGKSYANWRLAHASTHPWMVFIDADVWLAPDALRCLVDHARTSPLDPKLISGPPRQITGSWLEHLLIPLLHYIILGFLPLYAARRNKDPKFAAAVGQLMLMDRETYFAVDGHQAIPTTFHDGVKMSRHFRESGHFTDVVNISPLVSCRLYHNAGEVWNGLLKNANEGLGAPGVIGPMTFLLVGGQVIPWILVFFASGVAQILLIICCVISLLPRIIAAAKFQQPWLSALFHPLGVLVLESIQWVGFSRAARGLTTQWKGRPSIQP